MIARASARRGLTVREFAGRAKRDVKVVTRWFQSENPMHKTVERACRALKFDEPAVVARALLCKLKPGDAGILRSRIYRAIDEVGRESLGALSTIRAMEVLGWLESRPTSVTLDVGRACILSLHALDGDAEQRNPILEIDQKQARTFGPILGATLGALKKNGFSTFAFTNWQLSEDARAALALEAQAWTFLLCEALGFETLIYSGRAEAIDSAQDSDIPAFINNSALKDGQELHALLRPYLSLGASYFSGDARLARQRFYRAMRASKSAFRETFYATESEKRQ